MNPVNIKDFEILTAARETKKKLRKRIILSFRLFLILMISLVIYSFIEPYLLKINRIEFQDEDLPESFNGFKIIFIADIHHGPYFSRKRVKKLVTKINDLKPDLIIMGGDYVHEDVKYIAPCFEELSHLKSKLGTYAVLGNHDHWESTLRSEKQMSKAKIKILDNQSYWINYNGARIKLGGVGDLWEDSQKIEGTIHDVKTEDFVILVSHNPDFAEEITTDKIDLVLAGHTHGGQVTFFGLSAPVLPSNFKQKYRRGFVKAPATTVFITVGVGTITPPVRFFCRPEIVELTLVSK